MNKNNLFYSWSSIACFRAFFFRETQTSQGYSFSIWKTTNSWKTKVSTSSLIVTSPPLVLSYIKASRSTIFLKKGNGIRSRQKKKKDMGCMSSSHWKGIGPKQAFVSHLTQFDIWWYLIGSKSIVIKRISREQARGKKLASNQINQKIRVQPNIFS